MGRRSNALADRIEQGAAELAKFADSLSDADWKKPGSTAGTDKRPVGVIVHHVANMYPIEIDVAKTIASGKAITDVTWDAVAGINAGHAKDQANVTKAAALEFLRKNSREAAEAVRAFTDEQLDTAAPVLAELRRPGHRSVRHRRPRPAPRLAPPASPPRVARASNATSFPRRIRPYGPRRTPSPGGRGLG